MKRLTLTPRPDWQARVESVGLTFHTLANGDPYWDETACYQFTAAEIDTLEAAGNELQTMSLAAAQHIIDKKRYAELDIPAEAIPAIESTWNAEPPALYGRFDLSWAGAASRTPPKLLEYNADTPTSLLEAAVVQWHWLKDLAAAPNSGIPGGPDQFNSLHEKLIAKWKDVGPFLSMPVYFASIENPDAPEDLLTAAYLRDTAEQAGLLTQSIAMPDIGWNDALQSFVDLEDAPIASLFKLYPWETMLQEEFAPHALATLATTPPSLHWIEPIWKMLLSNKGLLPILWELYPNHPLLLEAYFDSPRDLRDYVRKPLHSREGANITLVRDNLTVASTDGPYHGRQIYQALAPEAVFSAGSQSSPGQTSATPAPRFPILGLWMIDQECCGLGLRESSTPITGNMSSFLPHFFV